MCRVWRQTNLNTGQVWDCQKFDWMVCVGLERAAATSLCSGVWRKECGRLLPGQPSSRNTKAKCQYELLCGGDVEYRPPCYNCPSLAQNTKLVTTAPALLCLFCPAGVAVPLLWLISSVRAATTGLCGQPTRPSNGVSTNGRKLHSTRQ